MEFGFLLQMAMRYEQRVESHLILSNQRIGGRGLVPIKMKQKSFFDGYYSKRVKFSAMRCGTSFSSYLVAC